jgi:hypothetical protein
MTPATRWSGEALPLGQSIDRVLYDLRREDAGERLLLDSASLADIIEDSGGVLAFDALVMPYAQVARKMELLNGVMQRSGQAVKPVSVQISEPFKQSGVANVAAVFELSDGQTVSIYFHNPDVTPNKMAGSDEIISWKWLLNKKDITLVVAPERGEDLNVREVARRIMKLAEKNSAAFQRANGKRAETLQRIEGIKAEVAGLEKELKTALSDLERAKFEAEEKAIQAALPVAPEREEEIGAFGPIYPSYENNPEAAIAKLMAEKKGKVPGAFHHPDLGAIAFVYGDASMGLRHIEKKRGIEYVNRIPDVLRKGRVVRDEKLPRAYLVTDDDPPHVITIRLDFDGKAKTWVITSFDDDRGKFVRQARTSDVPPVTASPRIPDATGQVQSSRSVAENQPVEKQENSGEGKEAADITESFGLDAQHIEDGGGSEKATSPVITASLQAADENTPLSAKEVKQWLLNKIDQAMSAAPSSEEFAALSEANELKDEDKYVVFDVPGDGKFKVMNFKDRLSAFKKKVEASAGFKAVPVKSARNSTKENFGKGSVSDTSIREMMEGGDLTSAYALAEQGSKPILFGASVKSNLPPVTYGETKPFSPAGYEGVQMVSARVLHTVGGKSPKWAVVERSTGMSIGKGGISRESAETNAKSEFEQKKATPEKLREIIASSPKVSQEALGAQWLAWAEKEESRSDEESADAQWRKDRTKADLKENDERETAKEAAKTSAHEPRKAEESSDESYNTAFEARINYLEDRADRIGREKIKEEARNSIAGMSLARGFGETVEQFYDKNPLLKAKRDATAEWIDGRKPAANKPDLSYRSFDEGAPQNSEKIVR